MHAIISLLIVVGAIFFITSFIAPASRTPAPFTQPPRQEYAQPPTQTQTYTPPSAISITQPAPVITNFTVSSRVATSSGVTLTASGSLSAEDRKTGISYWFEYWTANGSILNKTLTRNIGQIENAEGMPYASFQEYLYMRDLPLYSIIPFRFVIKGARTFESEISSFTTDGPAQ